MTLVKLTEWPGVLRDWLDERIGMSRADRYLWESCRTLEDLGQTTALWLEGRIKSQPGYQPRCGPDDETTDLIPTLAALNRVGFVTDSSQPGMDETVGYDGAPWRQRAAVTGFADDDTLAWLTAAMRGTRYTLSAVRCRNKYRTDNTGTVVTTRDGQPWTTFGAGIPAYLVNRLYCECSPAMRQVLRGASQVTVYDPKWGSNDLWPVLHAAAEARTAVTS